MSLIGGFPLSFEKARSNLGLGVRKSKVYLILALALLLVPCLIIILVLFWLTFSVRWTQVTEFWHKAQITIWDIFGIVSKCLLCSSH